MELMQQQHLDALCTLPLQSFAPEGAGQVAELASEGQHIEEEAQSQGQPGVTLSMLHQAHQLLSILIPACRRWACCIMKLATQMQLEDWIRITHVSKGINTCRLDVTKPNIVEGGPMRRVQRGMS